MGLWQDRGVRGRLIFAILWNAIAAFGIAAVVLAPKPGDQWFLPLVGLMVLIGLALLLDVIVRFARRG